MSLFSCGRGVIFFKDWLQLFSHKISLMQWLLSFCLLCYKGSCPDLMSRNEHPDPRPLAMALTPQLPPRTHRPLCLSVSSDSNGRFKALETQEWKNNLKAQVRRCSVATSLLVIMSSKQRALVGKHCKLLFCCIPLMCSSVYFSC